MTAFSESFYLMSIHYVFSWPISTFLLFSQIGKPVLDTCHHSHPLATTLTLLPPLFPFCPLSLPLATSLSLLPPLSPSCHHSHPLATTLTLLPPLSPSCHHS